MSSDVIQSTPQPTPQKYPDGSLVHINGEEWTVEALACRDGDTLLPRQEDRGEAYNLYRLIKHNTRSIFRWQFEIDAENSKEEGTDEAST